MCKIILFLKLHLLTLFVSKLTMFFLFSANMSSEIQNEKKAPVEIINISSLEESDQGTSSREILEVSSTSFEESVVEVSSTNFEERKEYLSVSSGTSFDEGPMLTQAPEEEPAGHTLTLEVSTSASSSSSNTVFGLDSSLPSSSSIGKFLADSSR